MNIDRNEQAGTLAEQGRLGHPYNEFHDPKRRCGLQGKAPWLHLGHEEMQSGSVSPQSGQSDPDTATASNPGTLTVLDLLSPTSDHPPAVNLLALGLAMDDNNGEGPVDGLGGGGDTTSVGTSTDNSQQSSVEIA